MHHSIPRYSGLAISVGWPCGTHPASHGSSKSEAMNEVGEGSPVVLIGSRADTQDEVIEFTLRCPVNSRPGAWTRLAQYQTVRLRSDQSFPIPILVTK
jgi:hypothetical protein